MYTETKVFLCYASQAKQQELLQQEQSLKSIQQAVNQFQVQEDTLQRSMSELQALQHNTAQRVRPPCTPSLTVTCSCKCKLLTQ